MPKLLVFSYNGFSDTNANGKTLKALLNAWRPNELAQFYCGAEPQDFEFCHHYFNVTDGAMLKAFLGKRSSRIRNYDPTHSGSDLLSSAKPQSGTTGIPSLLRKHNYNFFLRLLREILWSVSPWGKQEFRKWVADFSPDAIFYMVGESRFMDRLVARTAAAFDLPLVLYNAEAYRLVDTTQRKGLDKLFYVLAKRSYARLRSSAGCVVYNSSYLREGYAAAYGTDRRAVVCYNCANFDTTAYHNQNAALSLVYFGNLGVGRVPSLIETSRILGELDPTLFIDVFGNASEENAALLSDAAHIRYHGLMPPHKLTDLKEKADILIHVESFDHEIAPKLKYAFSTKLAQYLAAGRCVVSYAPRMTASTQYLLTTDCALVAEDPRELREVLHRAITDHSLRVLYAQKARKVAGENHDPSVVGRQVLNEVEELLR